MVWGENLSALAQLPVLENASGKWHRLEGRTESDWRKVSVLPGVFPRDFRDIWTLPERLANVEVFMALLFMEIQ